MGSHQLTCVVDLNCHELMTYTVLKLQE